jgi:TRAP-type uncharacterized transport system fused permease subunit
MSFRFAKMLYIMPLLFAFTPILNFTDPAGAVWTMVSATVGTLAFAAWTIGYLHRATTKAEWTLLALAAFACFLPLDVRIIDAAPGYAINIGGWLLLAAVSLWQKKTLQPNA